MTDVAVATLKEAISEGISNLFRLAGVQLVDSPRFPPTKVFQVPVTSIDVIHVQKGFPDGEAKLNDSVNRAFEDVMGVLRSDKPPRGVRIIVSVSRMHFMYHIYVTIETFS